MMLVQLDESKVRFVKLAVKWDNLSKYYLDSGVLIILTLPYVVFLLYLNYRHTRKLNVHEHNWQKNTFSYIVALIKKKKLCSYCE